MKRIKFNFQGKQRVHTFFFGTNPGTTGFSIRDDKGILHDCLLTGDVVNIYGLDSDKLEEKSKAVEF
jgi:hypothetical protein